MEFELLVSLCEIALETFGLAVKADLLNWPQPEVLTTGIAVT